MEPSIDDLGFFRIPPLHVQVTWYPSLQKTVWLLNHLHQFVKVGAQSSQKIGLQLNSIAASYIL